MVDNQDDRKHWLEWLNNGASLVAALIGILIAVQTIRLNNEIDRLNENIEASSLISDLIGALTSEDVKQDIALLALDNALTSNPEEDKADRANRYKKLVAEIAASLLNQALRIDAGEDGASLSKQIQEESRTARGILERLAQEPQGPAYQRIAQTALDRYQENVRRSDAPTGQSQAQITYDESSNSNPEAVVKAEVSIRGEEALTPLQREQQTLEIATAAEAVSAIAEAAATDKVAYLHYDNARLTASMETLKATLEEQEWFVTDKIELVRPDAFNCAVSSDIRFFHEADEQLARDLKQRLAAESIADLKPYTDALRLIDLSNWSQADLVPERQLELWIVTQGETCRQQRSQSARS